MLWVFLVIVILISIAVSCVVILPLWRKVEAIESMCEMLSKAVMGQYDEKED